MITKIIAYQVLEELTKVQFIEIAHQLEEYFHAKQPGFIDTKLAFEEKKNIWVMLQH